MDNMDKNGPTKTQPACSAMSKKRYQEIRDVVSSLVPSPDVADAIMERIRTIMKFDPSVGAYPPHRLKLIRERLNNVAEERGVSTYVASGKKDRYHNKKLDERARK